MIKKLSRARLSNQGVSQGANQAANRRAFKAQQTLILCSFVPKQLFPFLLDDDKKGLLKLQSLFRSADSQVWELLISVDKHKGHAVSNEYLTRLIQSTNDEMLGAS